MTEAAAPLPEAGGPAGSPPPVLRPRRRGTFRAVLLTLLVPGLGHVSLGQRRRGAAFLALVAAAFAIGIALGGELPRSVPTPFSALAIVTTSATGVFSAAARLLGLGTGNPASPTSEYGDAYLLTAGTMNLLLAVDLLVKRLREPA